MQTHKIEKEIRWKTLIGMIAATQLVGFSGALLAGMDMMRIRLATWNLPWFTPNRMVFMVIWPCLYLLIAIAAYLTTVHAGEGEAKCALTLFWVQLAMNCLWQPVFFRYQMLWFSAFWLLILVGVIIACMVRFDRFSRTASLLMVPYLAWSIFGLLLNVSIAYLNT